MIIQRAPNHLNLGRQTVKALHFDRISYWKVIAEETESVAARGDTRKLYPLLKYGSYRPTKPGEGWRQSGCIIAD